MFMRNKRYGLSWDISDGGETGIRTLGTIASTTVFETAPFDRSGISPWGRLIIVVENACKRAWLHVFVDGLGG
ncbi:hypothetical protein AA0313_2753 [Acetobacter indonesiensis NRIC 0313]|uniref:Uncharacterized protein n=1 Tax=Acetobacter indonesiensis TaxID=104101 RepID=A0ABQ0K564_9PROT|nr:hypothetical protein Abin_011_016 [Acetobacter indonesiensis]GBQ61547.1 hypothetical protein AA0313_2753 [Acetobacter indonesiensis NRIC 0313]